jgi:acetolactate decarboxylase
MKKIALTFLLLYFLSSFCIAQEKKETDDILFQRGTIHSLIKGVFDGSLTLRELKTHGDLGIGTYNGLDGEMVLLNGSFYRVKNDGFAYPAPPAAKTPFACVTFFTPDKTVIPENPLNYPDLKKFIDNILPSRNIPYAIRITGSFTYVKTRSVPHQTKPYPLLTEIVKKQPVFEMNNISGTLVGFRLPADFKGLNVPGYHLHFIDTEYSRGGHLLNCTTSKVRIELDETSDMLLSLPKDAAFLSTDLDSPAGEKINYVEKENK